MSIEDRYLTRLANFYAPDVEPTDTTSIDGMQLAAGPSGTVSDAGNGMGAVRRVGRGGVPYRPPSMRDITEPAGAMLDMGAATVKGATQGFLGLPGDLEGIGRLLLEKMGVGVDQNTVLPKTEEVKKWLDTNVGQVGNGQNPYETIGEVTAPGGQIKALKAAGRGAKALAPKAGEMVIDGMNKLGSPVQMNMMPDGPAMAAKPAAPVNDLGFYSAVEQAALNVQRKSGSGQAFLNDITKGENVKSDEIKWIGLDEFLKGKKSVTKQEVQDYIAQNKVDIKEVTLGGQEPFDEQRLAQLESEFRALKQHPIDDPSFGEDKYDEMIRLLNIRDQSTTDSLYRSAESAMRAAQRAQAKGMNITAEKYFRESELYNTRAEKLDLEGQGMSNPPKFDKYQLPGGENYREILLTMPNKEPAMPKGYEVTSVQYDDGTSRYFAETPTTRSAAYKTEEDAKAELQRMVTGLKGFRENLDSFKSSHWDEKNVLAHIRVNDRVDADGKKMLLVEEVQSDWHQAGRDKGYKKPMGQLPDGWSVNEAPGTNGTWVVKDETGRMVNQGSSRDDALNFALSGGSGVPDAPMKDTWYQLALKRVLKYAADNGYERVGLTTGSRQAERFDLSKQVDEITVPMVNAEDGTRSVRIDPTEGTSIKLMVDKDGVVTGYGAGSTQFSGKKLNEVIGKEMADKVMKAEADAKFSGLDLQVGGEGMKKYYDEIYPTYLQKYGKKWGAKVGETRLQGTASKDELAAQVYGSGETYKNLPSESKRKIDQMYMNKGEPVRFVDITPEMRQSVGKGQPLFSATAAGAGTGAATMQDKEKQ